MSSDDKQQKYGFSRRNLLKGALASSLVPAIGSGQQAMAAGMSSSDNSEINLTASHDFYGNEGQTGITTPPQHYTMFMALDLVEQDRELFQALLQQWTSAIAAMTQGKPIGSVEPTATDAVGDDTGEALGLGPASLTVTVGFGPNVFSEKMGLSHVKPAKLRPLKPLPSDDLRPEMTGGDLSIQACADDPQVCYHAIRNLSRIARLIGIAQTRWTVMGFGRASAGKGQETPRNIFGFKDGTRNLREPEEFRKFVWLLDDCPEWQRWGTYQVVRKIAMHIEIWDVDRIEDQNNNFGRHKQSGAPLGQSHEFDTPDFNKKGPDGQPYIPENCHISLAAYEHNQGIRILRRPYNYTNGLDDMGQLDAGLLFMAYQNDPEHFEQLQTKLGSADLLNEYISHIGSGIFFVPPAPKKGEYIGQAMFG